MEQEKVNKKLIIIMAVITVIVVGFVVFIVCGGDELIFSKSSNESNTSYSNSKSNNKKNNNITTNNNLNSVNNSTNNYNNVNQVNTTNTTNTINSNNNNKGTIEWNTKKFSLEGVEYSFGDKYSKFVTNGWNLANLQQNYTVPANATEYKYSTLKKDNTTNKTVRAYFKNSTTSDLSINNCQINNIEVATNSVKFELAGGICIGTSKDDVIRTYGQPTTSNSDSNINYQKNTENLRLYFDTNGKLMSIYYNTTK